VTHTKMTLEVFLPTTSLARVQDFSKEFDTLRKAHRGEFLLVTISGPVTVLTPEKENPHGRNRSTEERPEQPQTSAPSKTTTETKPATSPAPTPKDETKAASQPAGSPAATPASPVAPEGEKRGPGRPKSAGTATASAPKPTVEPSEMGMGQLLKAVNAASAKVKVANSRAAEAADELVVLTEEMNKRLQ
jgi:hypothetical protein